ncbi:hypothetical protein QBC47DRAFT_67617 [Echria macrotheca]|uniref:Uncharacterized protein n=1 Tax=Echria macrotheca TaxID=438768 RepID=A0AAJ0B8K5_9PEZI|nr:hypothetical protein QBC47DRAFT_67617 [Echria macrotheca]
MALFFSLHQRAWRKVPARVGHPAGASMLVLVEKSARSRRSAPERIRSWPLIGVHRGHNTAVALDPVCAPTVASRRHRGRWRVASAVPLSRLTGRRPQRQRRRERDAERGSLVVDEVACAIPTHRRLGRVFARPQCRRRGIITSWSWPHADLGSWGRLRRLGARPDRLADRRTPWKASPLDECSFRATLPCTSHRSQQPLSLNLGAALMASLAQPPPSRWISPIQIRPPPFPLYHPAVC